LPNLDDRSGASRQVDSISFNSKGNQEAKTKPVPPKKKIEILPKIRRDRITRGTNSWLDDTDKNFGPDLPLLFKLHEIWSVDSQEKD